MSSSPPTALVTGASRGLGLETARQLGARGYRVLQAVRDARAGDGDTWSLDVTAPASVAALAERLVREGVHLDVLVNNAGISLKGFDVAVVRGTLAVNFFGALRVTQALSGASRCSAFTP